MSERIPRSRRLLNVLADCEEVVVVTHDNPDPDAMATGWAVWLLVKERLGKPVRLIGGGDVLRAENRHMLTLLAPPLALVSGAVLSQGAVVVLVDCQTGGENYLFCDDAVEPVAVIDHHEGRPSRPRAAFRDVRPRVAASASIAASYLREQRLKPDVRLATALVFAIRSETRGNETHYSRLDRSVLLWLSEQYDPGWLAEIESAPLAPGYYSDLVLALQSTFLYDDTAFCLLPRASGPEIVGEVADLLIRCESIWRVLCGAVVGEDLLLSVRTDYENEDAAQLAQKTLAGIGRGGGHRHRAGGKISGVGPRITEDFENELRDRWLAIAKVDRQRGTRLIARREIVENL